jgi:hypothetical protein
MASSSTESKLEFRSVDFCRGRKKWRKTLEARERTNKQLYSYTCMTPSPGTFTIFI